MKILMTAALLCFSTASICAQDLSKNEVPSNLQSLFTATYANSRDVEWEKKGNHYKVEFEVNNRDHDLWYDADGTIIKSKIEIAESDLPAEVATALKNKYADYKVDSVEVREENGEKTYEIEIDKGWTLERKLVLDASGKIISDRED